MKRLLFIALLFIGISASAQVTTTNNPSFVSPGTTSATLVTLPSNAPYIVTILVRFPSTNVSTVKLSSIGSATISESPDHVADTYTWLTVTGGRFYVQLANSADDIEISY